MIDDIIQEATEAEEQGRDAGYAVGELLRIINQQKPEIRDLKRKLKDEQKSVEKIAVKYFKQAEELERLKLEIEILIRKKEALRDEVAEKQAEIERLREQIKKGDKIYEEAMLNAEAKKDNLKQVIEQLKLSQAEIVELKSEAYREFAEKLKEISKEVTVPYIADTSIQEHKTGMFYYGKEDFDNLLNELTRNLHGTCTDSNE